MLRPPQTPSSEYSNNNSYGKFKGEGHPVTFYDWHRGGRNEVLLIINLGARAGVKVTPRNSSRPAVQFTPLFKSPQPHIASDKRSSPAPSVFFPPLTMKVQIIRPQKTHKKHVCVCVCVFYALVFRISDRKTKKLSTFMNCTNILQFHTHDYKLEDLPNCYHLERKQTNC
jgi:hypothetical protein